MTAMYTSKEERCWSAAHVIVCYIWYVSHVHNTSEQQLSVQSFLMGEMNTITDNPESTTTQLKSQVKLKHSANKMAIFKQTKEKIKPVSASVLHSRKILRAVVLCVQIADETRSKGQIINLCLFLVCYSFNKLSRIQEPWYQLLMQQGQQIAAVDDLVVYTRI